MKKYLLIFLFISSYSFSQSSGITYQAVIYNPKGEDLPGFDNPNLLVKDEMVCMKFGIIDATGLLEYEENVSVVTDGFGMVNLLIGSYIQTDGYAASFNNVNWGPEAKFLKVDTFRLGLNSKAAFSAISIPLPDTTISMSFF